MAVEITPEVADEMTTAVIHFLQDKYPGIDTFTAMEALCREWNGADQGRILLPIESNEDSPLMKRLEDWSQRKGCSAEEQWDVN
jgi:hypothetical protein